MKICILSDSHDNDQLLDHAFALALDAGAEVILHCGDVVAANTLKLARNPHVPLHIIHGNNTGDLFALAKYAGDPENQVHYHGQDASLSLGGRRIFMVHYPHYARAMACTGDWDLVCCGHSHKGLIEQLPNLKGEQTLLVNPGSVGGIGSPATLVMGDLARMEFELIQIAE